MQQGLGTFAATVCAGLLFLLMIITCVDVVARYVFNAPLRGGFELTELLLAAIIFSALPLTTARREHVAFDSFEPVPAAAMGFVNRVAALLSAVAVAFLGWRLWIYADSLRAGKLVSATLGLPMYPLAYLMSVSSLTSAAVFAWFAIFNRNDEPSDISDA